MEERIKCQHLQPFTHPFVLQYPEIFLQRDSPVFVLVVPVEVYQLVDAVHGLLRTRYQQFIIEKMTDEDGREDVAGPREMDRNLGIGQRKELVRLVVVTRYGRRTVDENGSDQCRLRTDFPQSVEQFLRFVNAYASRFESTVRKITGLGIVGIA